MELASWEASQELDRVGVGLLSPAGWNSEVLSEVGLWSRSPQPGVCSPGGSSGLTFSVPTVPNHSGFLPKCLEIKGGESRKQHMLSLPTALAE